MRLDAVLTCSFIATEFPALGGLTLEEESPSSTIIKYMALLRYLLHCDSNLLILVELECFLSEVKHNKKM